MTYKTGRAANLRACGIVYIAIIANFVTLMTSKSFMSKCVTFIAVTHICIKGKIIIVILKWLEWNTPLVPEHTHRCCYVL
jgi:hypothetical protein